MAQKSLLQKINDIEKNDNWENNFQYSYLKLWFRNISKYSAEKTEKYENDNHNHSNSVNEVKLLGYVGQSPKKYQVTNQFVTYFTLATSRHYIDKSDGKQRVTTWHTILVRKSFVQEYVMKYVSKGTRIYVSGYLDDKNFDFTDDWQMKCPVHVVAENVIFLKKSQSSQNENSPYFVGIGDNYKVFD